MKKCKQKKNDSKSKKKKKKKMTEAVNVDTFVEQHLALLALEKREEDERVAAASSEQAAGRRTTLAVHAHEYSHGGRVLLDIRPKAPVCRVKRIDRSIVAAVA